MWQWLTLREHVSGSRFETTNAARVNMAPRLACGAAGTGAQFSTAMLHALLRRATYKRWHAYAIDVAVVNVA